jgi:hypothetical protein
MWQHPRLAWVLVGAALVCFIATTGVEGTDHNKRQAARWRWPDETPSRVGAGRLIPVGRPATDQLQLQPVAPKQPQLTNKFTPVDNRPRIRPTEKPAAAIVAPSLPPVIAKPVEADKITSDADIDPPATAKNASTVPLLKDAGKPGNPYILLNDIFPPQNSIRTKEQEEANFNSLQNKDLGGLDPSEVYLADDDLFVIRGFDFKKPYSADPPGPPISDYQAPAPLAPPPPEPGTVFYPSNETDATFNFFNPDFNSKDPSDLPFFPFVPGGLNEQQPNFPEDPNFLPFPFLPPPPPHWTEEKEFEENDIRDPFQSGGPAGGNFPFAQGAPPPGQGFALFNGTQGPPPPSGLNGFPGIGGGLPPFGNPQTGPPPGGLQRPPGFPPGVPPGGQGGAPPPSTSGPNANVTLVDEDEDVPFTPLFPERPVEFYYPTHNTTAQPPGPFGPGIFVPPPLQFFAPRNKSEKINVEISPKLFLPPFNLPNYYQKVSAPAVRPLPQRPQQPPPPGHLPTSQLDGFFGYNQQTQKVPAYKPIQSNPFVNPTKPKEQQQVPANGQYAPVKTILLDTNFKEVSKLPQLPQPHQPFGYSYQQGHPPFHTPVDPTAFGPGAQTPIKLSAPAQPNYNIPNQQQQHPQHPFYLPTKGTAPGVSLESDIDVNYRPQRPAINPDSELIDPALLNPTHTNPNPTQNWNPYTAVYAHQIQAPKYESLSQPTAQQPTISSSSREKPTNFVAVYRIGGGSYSYNLNGGR